MLQVESGIQPVQKTPTERNMEVKGQIRETLESMKVGDSFVIEGKVKKATVRSMAKLMEIRVSIGPDSEGKVRCWKK